MTPDPDRGAVTTGDAGDNPADEAAVASTAAAAAAAPELLAGSIGEYLRIWLRRIRSGESGALPVIVGLVVIVLYFQTRSSLFLSARNLVNLLTQSAFIITLGMAEVFVLLLGEIDLAAAFTSACGAVVALWIVALNYPWWVAVLAALAATAAYGALQGYIITRLRLPSFVVTLAGFLGLSGFLLFLISATGKIGVGGVIRQQSSVINDIEAGSLTPVASWVVMIALVALAGLIMYMRDHRRRVNGLVAPPLSITLLKIAAIAVAGIVVVLVGNTNRGSALLAVSGLPWVVLVVLAILVIYTIMLGRTRFGRYIYAIGGNSEAARRAGINTNRIRVAAFALCGLTAGITGIIFASYLGSISSNYNGGEAVLNAVAAAVIGGTSLYGGRGKMLDAVLGGLVVGVIANGLQLLGLSSAAQLMWTALVLLAAVTVDALTRRGRQTT
ncbi:MAG TPA: ABC transporter permease [Streptosporangiaceae bacterium]|nr:ABC transporter permease [Streptosporangiaceae bacterium]